MGHGFVLHCEGCGEHFNVSLGIGMLFPKVYEDLVADVEAGRFGEEMRELAAATEHFAIDAENHLFLCDTCGHWECAPGLSVYKPRDLGKVLTTRYGEKNVAEWGRAPYVTPDSLEADYFLVGEFAHRCCRCGDDMRMLGEREARRAPLKCPRCDHRLVRDDLDVRWD